MSGNLRDAAFQAIIDSFSPSAGYLSGNLADTAHRLIAALGSSTKGNLADAAHETLAALGTSTKGNLAEAGLSFLIGQSGLAITEQSVRDAAAQAILQGAWPIFFRRFGALGVGSDATFTRGGIGRSLDGLTEYAANVPMLEGDTLWMHPATTNLCANPGTPADQTINLASTGTYTLSVYGTGSCAIAQNTATITGAGSAEYATPVTIVCTGAGTVDLTITGALTAFQLEKLPVKSALCLEGSRPLDVLTWVPSAVLLNAFKDSHELTTIVKVRLGFAADSLPNSTLTNILALRGFSDSLLYLIRGALGAKSIASYDGTTVASTSLDYLAHTDYTVIQRINATPKNYVSVVDAGTLTNGALANYDGAFTLSVPPLVRAAYGNAVGPIGFKSILIFGRCLTDAEVLAWSAI